MSKIKKNFKKIISSVLAFAMVFGMGFSAVVSTDVEASDVDTTDDGKYTVTLDDAVNGKIEFAEQTDGRFKPGEKVNIKLVADEGCVPISFAIWEDDTGENLVSQKATDDLYSFTMPKGNLYVMAEFASADGEEYTVTINDSTHGKVILEDTDNAFMSGETAELSLKADDGYLPESISVKNAETGEEVYSDELYDDNIGIIMPETNVTVDVEFGEEDAVLTLSSSGIQTLASGTSLGTVTLTKTDVICKWVYVNSDGSYSGSTHNVAHYNVYGTAGETGGNSTGTYCSHLRAHFAAGSAQTYDLLGQTIGGVEFTQNLIDSLTLGHKYIDEQTSYTTDLKTALKQAYTWRTIHATAQHGLLCLTPSSSGISISTQREIYSNAQSYADTNSAKFDCWGLVYVNGTAQEIIQLFWEPASGFVTLVKASDNPSITDGNNCYDLSGAVYTLYTNQGCTDAAKDVNGNAAKLTTKSDGTTNTLEMSTGTYYIKETTTAKSGYYLNETIGTPVVVESGETTTVKGSDVDNPPKNDPAGITIYKLDEEGNRAEPQGDADLAGAEFTVRFYAGDYSENEIKSMEPTRTWTIKTIENDGEYIASLIDEDCYVPEKSDECYHSLAGNIVLPLGTYTIQETSAPTGYLIEGDFYDGNEQKLCQAGDVFYTQLLDEGDATWMYGGNYYTQSDVPIRGGVEIQKRDAQSLRTEAQGSGDFEGIEYEIVSDAENDVLVDGEWYSKGDVVYHLTTDENGYASTESDTLPYGHYHINELQSGNSNTHATADGSYLLGDDGHEDAETVDTVTSIPFFIEEEGVIVDLTGGEDSILEADEAMNDIVIRGDIALKKHEASTQSPLSVPFKVTSMTTGESHVFWTDENGDYSTDSTWIPHTYMTDAGEDWTDGFWFYGYADWENCGVEVDDALGALPIDDYYLDELRCEANEGLELVHTTFHVYQDERVIDLGTIDNYEQLIDLKTTLTNDWTGEHQSTIFENHDISLTDVVSYEGLDVGEEYTMRGVLMDKETGEPVVDADTGLEVTKEVTFVPEESDGEIEITFEFNAYGMHDTYVVAFEYLYDAAGNCIGMHEDIDDEGQTVQLLVPTVWTYAAETSTGLKSIEPKEEVEITDYLDVTDLIVGHTYYVYGRAVNKDTGELILDHDGEPLELYIEFVADSEEMLLDIMNFHFNAADLAGQEVVFEEYIYADADREILICEEEDLGSAEQTVYFLGDIQLGTTLLDEETGEHVSYAGDHVVLTDEVEYDGAKVGETYTVTGILMDKETGLAVTDEDGNEITAESEPFVAEAEHGFVEVTFEFDASDLAGDAVVAYEFMYNSEGTLVSAHEDINDEDQTVEFPEIGTTLVDKDTGYHGAVSDDHVELVDTVEYEGLIPGYTYIVKGTLMDKATNEPLLDADGNEITAESEPFVAEESEGTVEVTFEFDASEIEDVYSVAFEYLYMVEEVEDEEETPEEHLVATHEDINDEGQTVKLSPVYIGTTLLDEASGTHEADADGRVTLVDTVEYDGLTEGETYTLEGTLMDKSTGTALKDANGNAITAESTFTAEGTSGVAVVTFTFDATDMNGIFAVAFEQLYDNFGNLVASHEDINDEAQTVKLVHEVEETTTAVINNTNTSGEGPKTGDYTNIILWAVLGILAVGGCTAGFVVYRRRKKAD